MDEPTLVIPICHYAPKAFVITGDIAQKPPHLTMEHDLGPGKISTNPFVLHLFRFDAEPTLLATRSFLQRNDSENVRPRDMQ